ncbi:MAG: hypothetical protein H0T84_15200 [Tatlockia sp.]|nr:hypothetical protein [Tatlockia sp.]
MLDLKDISQLVEEAFCNLAFVSFDERDINFTFFKLEGMSGEQNAFMAIKQQDLNKMYAMLKRLEKAIDYYTAETPLFLEQMSRYKTIYDNPEARKHLGALKDPEELISHRSRNLHRLQEINRLYTNHLYTLEKRTFNELIYKPDSTTNEGLKKIVDCTTNLLTLMDKINDFRQREIVTEHKESIIELETQWFKIGYSLAEKGLIDLAVDCWLKIPPQSELYVKAHFEAFECVYHAKIEEKSTHFSAFLDALPTCYSNKKTLITFSENEKKMFNSCLLTAVGINSYYQVVESIDDKTINLLLRYVLLKAALEDLKANPALKVGKTNTLFAEPRLQGLLSRLDKLLPDIPISIENLADLENLISGKGGLWEKIRPGINAALFTNESLKSMIKGVFKQEALQKDQDESKSPGVSGFG